VSSVLFFCFLAAAAPAQRPAHEVERLIATDGGRPDDGTFETVTWHRSERFTGASQTVSLLGGTYKVYAAGERQDDRVTVEFMDKGTGKILGTFELGGAPPVKRAILTVATASICLMTVKPAQTVHARRVQSYDVVIGLVRQ
jgi:hypothetical protein